MKQKRLSPVTRRKSTANHPFHRRHNLTPALRAVKNNWATKLQSKRKLRLEDLAHKRRDVATFQAIKTDLANAGVGVSEEVGAQGGEERRERWDIWG